ncbi:MAG: hypothetical protein HC902_09895 [Calothrix sp. SM1_5_4]|nr:hypothetical protein [Calothrix sp. SM1_5_4]
MKRREFLSTGLALSAGAVALKSAFNVKPAFAAGGITDKDILKEGQPTTIANYCENPAKKPNKFCADWKAGTCKDCTFYNKDNSATTFKGKKYARCQLLTDPKKPQFVAEGAWCATYVKQA